MTAIIFIEQKGIYIGEPWQLIFEYLNWLVFNTSIINGYPNTGFMTAFVQWTLQYEWVFYLSLPIIAYVMRLGWLAVFALLVLLGLGTLYPQTILGIKTNILKFFVVGGMTAYLNVYLPHLKQVFCRPVVSLISISALLISLLLPKYYGPAYIFLLPIAFVPIAFGNNYFGFLSKPASIVLGEISYSIYLLHGLLLYVLFAWLVVVDIHTMNWFSYLSMMPIIGTLAVLLATVGYLYVEAPGIRLGKKFKFFTS